MSALRRLSVFILVLTLGAAAALAVRHPDLHWPNQVMTIGALTGNPAKFDGQQVRVSGVVAARFGIMGLGGFRLRDPGSGEEIAVVVLGGAMPEKGSTVSVSGKFGQAIAIGKVSGAVIIRDR